MKKNKLSNAPSQNTSPVPYRKSFQDILSRPSLYLSDPDINLDEDALSTRSTDRNSTAFVGTTTARNDYETIDKRRQQHRGSNYDDQKDHGYETIPASGSSQTTTTTVVSNDGVEQHRTRSSAPAGIYTTGIELGWTVQFCLVIFCSLLLSKNVFFSSYFRDIRGLLCEANMKLIMFSCCDVYYTYNYDCIIWQTPHFLYSPCMLHNNVWLTDITNRFRLNKQNKISW